MPLLNCNCEVGLEHGQGRAGICLEKEGLFKTRHAREKAAVTGERTRLSHH